MQRKIPNLKHSDFSVRLLGTLPYYEEYFNSRKEKCVFAKAKIWAIKANKYFDLVNHKVSVVSRLQNGEDYSESNKPFLFS